MMKIIKRVINKKIKGCEKMYIEYLLDKRPIIGAVKCVEDLDKVPKGKVSVLFVLRSKLSNLPRLVEEAKELDVLIFLHIDMVKGIGNDKEAIKYLAEEIKIDGIVTTKSYLIKIAKKEDLITVQRLFLLDSESLITGANIINNTKPDMIEVLPGIVVPKMKDVLSEKIDVPIIAGGLIRTPEQVKEILGHDVIAVSTSEKELWEMEFNN